MTQTRKGKQWYFGMKAHIGDMSQFTALLHGEEDRVSADRGYDYPQVHAHLQQNLTEDWVARKSKTKQPLDAWTRGLNHAIAQLRAICEHPFRILKRQFGYTEVRYRGLEKNTAQLFTLFALGNLYQVRRALLASGA
jgi:IS5 family transposase